MFTPSYIRIPLHHVDRESEGSAYPSITRYWDARAMKYAVPMLFKLKDSEGGDAHEINVFLEHLAGDMKAAMIFAKRGLLETMKHLKHSRLVDGSPSVGLPVPLHTFVEKKKKLRGSRPLYTR